MVMAGLRLHAGTSARRGSRRSLGRRGHHSVRDRLLRTCVRMSRPDRRCCDGGDQRFDVGAQLGKRPCDDGRTSAHQIPARWEWLIVWQARHQGAEPPPHLVADDGRAHGAADRKRHAGWRRGGIGKKGAPQHSGSGTETVLRQARKDAPLPDAPDQADSLARPLSRRDFNTARPARVLIR